MMRVEGPALELVREVLGAVGVGSQVTELPDGILSQVVDVAPIMRRGRTIGGTEGVWSASIANVHGGAGEIATPIDPYAMATAANGYPNPVPKGFDVWILNAYGIASAAGVIAASPRSVLYAQLPGTTVAFGAVASIRLLRVFAGQTLMSGLISFLTTFAAASGLDSPDWPSSLFQPIRVPRGSTIGWNSAAGAAGTLTAMMWLGLFPAALGQDAE